MLALPAGASIFTERVSCHADSSDRFAGGEVGVGNEAPDIPEHWLKRHPEAGHGADSSDREVGAGNEALEARGAH